MAGPNFTIHPNARAADTYLDYSSCFQRKKNELKFNSGAFKGVIQDKTANSNNITAAELQNIFTGLTAAQAEYLIKTADTGSKTVSTHDGQLDWQELQAAIKKADEADTTFDGIVSFDNFQTLVTEPVVPAPAAPTTAASATSSTSQASSAQSTAPSVAKPAVNENFSSYSHQSSGGLGHGNLGNDKGLGLAAVAAFAIFAGIGLSQRHQGYYC